jgi:uncharacterized protein with HEPN domain
VKNIKLYISDIIESIAKIEEYTSNISEADFLKSTQSQDSVVRRIEIIGEAVKRIPAEFRDKHPDIPWKKIAGMRDILAHEYASVLMKRVWKVAKEDIITLKSQIEKIAKTI